MMIKNIFSGLLVLLSLQALCVTYTSVHSGSFNTATNWSPAVVPDLNNPSTLVNINHSITIPAGGQTQLKGSITVNTGGTLTTPNPLNIIGGNLKITGTVNIQNDLTLANSSSSVLINYGGSLNVTSSVNNQGNIVCYGYFSIGGDFNNKPGGSLTVPYLGYVYVVSNVNNKGTITLGGGTICWEGAWNQDPPQGQGILLQGNCYISSGPLGISLVSFEVSCEGSWIAISWVTENEENNDHFTVERSKDLISWELVATYPGSLNSGGRLTYYLLDENPNTGGNYYRLSQTDTDGSITLFENQWLRYIDCSEQGNLTVFPVPLINSLTINNLPGQVKWICIFDPAGRKIMQVYPQSPDIEVDVSILHPGVYYLCTDQGLVRKIVK